MNTRKLIPILIAALALVPTGHLAGAVFALDECAVLSGPFLQTDGLGFCLEGKRTSLYGSTLYPFWQYNGQILRGDGWVHPEFVQYIDFILNMAQAAHLNTLRPTDYLAGAQTWDDPEVWKNMDYLIGEAHKRSILIILDLSALRQWLGKHGHDFLYNASDWMDFVRFVARRYLNEPAIAEYSIAGEIKPEKNGGASPQQYLQFYTAVEDALYEADEGHHLISAGGLSYLNFDSQIPWREIFSLPHNAVAAIHVYSTGDRNITVSMVSKWARAQTQVFFVEEFGFSQDMGDAERASAFQDIYDWSRAYKAAGIIFWNLGPELAPASYEVSANTPLTWAVIQKNG